MSGILSDTYVATCDEIIENYCRDAGLKCVMTGDHHVRCSTRTAEALLKIEEATGSNGMFSGSGYTHIPLLSNTGVKVKFKNVFINKDYELVSGTFTAETDKGEL